MKKRLTEKSIQYLMRHKSGITSTYTQRDGREFSITAIHTCKGCRYGSRLQNHPYMDGIPRIPVMAASRYAVTYMHQM